MPQSRVFKYINTARPAARSPALRMLTVDPELKDGHVSVETDISVYYYTSGINQLLFNQPGFLERNFQYHKN